MSLSFYFWRVLLFEWGKRVQCIFLRLICGGTLANVLLYRPWRRCRVFVPLKSSELRSRLHMERRRRIQTLHLQHSKLPCELLEHRDECRYFDLQKV